jgi:hypothetical protein
VQPVGVEEVGPAVELDQRVRDRGVERHEEAQLAGVVAQRGVQPGCPLEALGVVEAGGRLGRELLDVLPERHGEPVAAHRLARHQRARRHDRVPAAGEPGRHVQLPALLCGLGVRVGGDRAGQHGGHPHYDRGRVEVHDHGERVVEHPRVGHREPEVAPRGARGGHGAVLAGAYLLRGHLVGERHGG